MDALDAQRLIDTMLMVLPVELSGKVVGYLASNIYPVTKYWPSVKHVGVALYCMQKFLPCIRSLGGVMPLSEARMTSTQDLLVITFYAMLESCFVRADDAVFSKEHYPPITTIFPQVPLSGDESFT